MGKAKHPLQMPRGLAPSCPQTSRASWGRFPRFLRLGEFSPQPQYQHGHTARSDKFLYQGNFCRCFLSFSQDVTLGICAIGEVETRAGLAAEPSSSASPTPRPPPPLKWDLLHSGHVSAPLP